MTLRYLSVCSGIEAATVAWHPLGWTPAAFAEIEAFPRAVLQHHYPAVPLHGDFTTIGADDYGPIDLLVGGTPCQSFSIAGLRGGLADDRGNLALEFLRLAERTRPRWLVWENVPGVYSATSHDSPHPCPPADDLDASDGPADGQEVVVEDEYDSDENHAFACFLAGLQELGYGFAYRTFDAQFFGLAQRRNRCFVVGHLGDWRRAAAVLFERHSLQGNPPPRREAGPSVAALTATGVGTCGADDNQGQAGHLIPQGYGGGVAPTLNAAFGSKLGLDNQHIDAGAGLFVAHSLRGEGFDASEDGTGRGTPIIPIDMRQASRGATMTNNRAEGSSGGAPGTGIGEAGDPAPTIASSHVPAICFSAKDHGADAMEDCSPTLRAGGHTGSHANAGVMPAVAFVDCHNGEVTGGNAATMGTRGSSANSPGPTLMQASAVRRLTPVECEALQGFPPNYTQIPYRNKPAAECPDGPRYKALGNSMAVPVMRWIGSRIARVDALASLESEAA